MAQARLESVDDALHEPRFTIFSTGIYMDSLQNMGFAALPKNAPEVLVKNTVYVRDPERIYRMRDSDRQKSFKGLVRRYISQLLHGCQNPSCTTPTCFSCRRRISSGPIRKLTVVSARTIACYLASQDDGEQALCPHKPAVPDEMVDTIVGKQEQLERSGGTGTDPATAGGSDEGPRQDCESCNENGEFILPDAIKDIPTPHIALAGVLKVSSTMAKFEDMGFNVPVKKQLKKDPKSFTQNLFDTHPLRMLEWLPPDRIEEQYVFAPEGRESEYTNLFLRTPQKQDLARPEESTKKQTATVSDRKLPESKSPQCNGTVQISSVDGQSLSSQLKPVLPPTQWPDNETATASVGLPSSPKSRRRRSLGPPESHRPSQLPQSIKEKLQSTGIPRAVKPQPCPPAPRRFFGQTPYDGPLKSYNIQSKKSAKHRRFSADEPTTVNHGFTTPSKLDERDNKESDPPKHENKSDFNPNNTVTPNFIRPPQSLSHLSCETIRALVELVEGLNPVTPIERVFVTSMGKPKPLQKAELHGLDHLMKPEFAFGHFLGDLAGVQDSQYAEADIFARQSIFYVFSNPESILRSFGNDRTEVGSEKAGFHVNRPHPLYIDSALRLLMVDQSQLIFDSLWAAIEALFTPPPELIPPRSPRLKAALSSATPNPSVPSHTSILKVPPSKARHFSDPEVAHIIIICLHALAASLPFASADAWSVVHSLRAQGKVAPDSNTVTPEMGPVVSRMMNAIEALENEMAMRLMKRLAKVVAARTYYSDIMKTKCRKGRKSKDGGSDLRSVMEIVCDHFANWKPPKKGEPHMGPWALQDLEQPIKKGLSIPAFVTEWIRSALLKEWDGKAEIPRCSVVGGAITMLASFYERLDHLQLEPELFHTPFISDRIDSLETPVEWLSSLSNLKTMHLLSHPFLFPPSSLVTYLRAINFSNMSRSFEASMTMSRMVMQIAFMDPSPDHGGLMPRLQKAVSHYLVLEVRRDNLLVDALDQLWRRERRELMRPLKVRMGMDEGEEGVDHGGVQQEFFRMVMSQALSPDYGLFAIDPRTRMTWFQPATLEPLYKYELLGLLVSLAVYNGLTLPVTFPKALYRKLLGLPVADIEHISDGWPDLAKGLTDLLAWTDGDVADVFYRTYEFSVEAFGTRLTIDMKTAIGTPWLPKAGGTGVALDGLEKLDVPSPWISSKTGASLRNRRSPSPPEYEESEMVTNANREEYVRDYISWLTDYSVSAQFKAFSRGFFVCLDRKALSMFSPSALQTIVEGYQDIDIAELERTARYDDGYTAKHRVIQDFWDVVRQYSAERKRQLLEFVTASDRVPVNGLGSILFVVQRSGGDSDRVPTSLTCFGRLLLPEYASKKKLAQKLKIALENGKGFGAP